MNISIFPQFIFQFFKTLYRLMQIHFLSSLEKDFIILALESQIQLIKCQGTVKPKFNPFYRTLWVTLSKFLKNWKSYTYIMKPETVMKWHKSCFKLY